MSEGVSGDSIARVAEFVRQWRMGRGHDQTTIYEVWFDADAEQASLLVADLATIVDQAKRDADLIGELRRALYEAAISSMPEDGLVLDHEAAMAWEEHDPDAPTSGSSTPDASEPAE